MITVDVAGHLSAQQRLQLLTLPTAKRKRLLGQLGRKVIVTSRKRLRTQQGLDGKAWEKRKRGNKKMLRKIGKQLIAVSTPQKVDVTFKNVRVGKIARRHQDGIDEPYSASKASKVYGTPDYSAPCTRAQAKALFNEGYKKRKQNGKGWQRASQKWLRENLSLGQAGLILRVMRDQASKKSWVIPLPERDFLGTTDAERSALTQEIFDNTIQSKS